MSEGCKNYVSWEAAIRIWWAQGWRGLLVLIIVSVILGFIPSLAVIKPLANWLVSIWALRASLVGQICCVFVRCHTQTVRAKHL